MLGASDVKNLAFNNRVAAKKDNLIFSKLNRSGFCKWLTKSNTSTKDKRFFVFNKYLLKTKKRLITKKTFNLFKKSWNRPNTKFLGAAYLNKFNNFYYKDIDGFFY